MRCADARVLLVGVGGLGCPAGLALARAGIGTLGICDDDAVERQNLHRQILFSDADVGAQKVEVAARELEAQAPRVLVRVHATRLLPDNGVALVRGYDVVVEGSDNYATKFLVADVCAMAGVPVVHGAAVRWIGTAFAVGAEGRPCYRCLFEDLPQGASEGCAEAGVVGPVTGIVGAIQADLALAIVGGASVSGELVTFDGRTDALRRRAVRPRADCPLCGNPDRNRRIEPEAYRSFVCD